MELSGQKVLVWGAAKSGIASSRFLAERGAVVALHDRKPLEEWPPAALELKERGVGLIAGELPSWLLDQIELLVLSPGVPRTAIPARYAERAGAEVIGEVELAARFMRGRMVAVTGSNGKTTTTTLVGELLKDGGIPTQVGGNIGTALIGLAETSVDDGWTVVELSSFQLESVDRFHANVAIALNVTPNHLDRYDSLADYAAAKHRIFRNQEPSDVAVINADDPIVSSWADGLRAHVVRFSTRQELVEGLFLRGRDLLSRTTDGEKVLVTRDEMLLQGLHNVENVLAALAAGLACGVSPDSMRETVRRFRPVEHRLEHAGTIGGVDFFNDSKATSVDAAVKALEALSDRSGKVVLILGGLGKKASYAPLAGLITNHVRRLVLIGEDAPVIEKELSGSSEMEHATDMPDAVRLAFAAAESGDAVLLAPACASFDMFRSFEHRGEVFKQAVQALSDTFVELGQPA
jgi:UDP-N-acetylmuramoylalanine--D-glutamate ligase